MSGPVAAESRQAAYGTIPQEHAHGKPLVYQVPSFGNPAGGTTRMGPGGAVVAPLTWS
jgi:hypothetical protein